MARRRGRRWLEARSGRGEASAARCARSTRPIRIRRGARRLPVGWSSMLCTRAQAAEAAVAETCRCRFRARPRLCTAMDCTRAFATGFIIDSPCPTAAHFGYDSALFRSWAEGVARIARAHPAARVEHVPRATCFRPSVAAWRSPCHLVRLARKRAFYARRGPHRCGSTPTQCRIQRSIVMRASCRVAYLAGTCHRASSWAFASLPGGRFETEDDRLCRSPFTRHRTGAARGTSAIAVPPRLSRRHRTCRRALRPTPRLLRHPGLTTCGVPMIRFGQRAGP